MDTDKKNSEGQTSADDNLNNNAHYKDGEITRPDDRDRNNSADDWDAEKSRTGRHK